MTGPPEPLGRRHEPPEQQLPAELERVHMVGIGGAGMSGIARILLDRGGLVSGSDAKESRGVVALRARGALINVGHDAAALDLLPGGPTAVITTHAAIPKTNPELVEAGRRGIPVLLRPVVLTLGNFCFRNPANLSKTNLSNRTVQSPSFAEKRRVTGASNLSISPVVSVR